MRARCVAGFTLLEVLVAIFVLALGVIGAAGMQLTALRTRQQSALLSDAVQLASAMADKMRANVGQMKHADGANPYLNLDYDGTAAPAAPAMLCFSPAANCDSGQLAQFDIYESEQQISTRLPGGRLVICRDAQVWDPARRALTWACGGGAGAPIVIKLGWQAKNPDGSASLDLGNFAAPAVAITLDSDS
jgi:type IV pilus assembly protein PilV